MLKRIVRHRRVWFVCLLAGLPIGCGGGGGGRKDRIVVTRIPDFYKGDLTRLAVVPFGNRTGVRGAAERIGDRISAELTNNATYEVYTRSHLCDILAEHDAIAAGIIDADLARTIGRVKAVQALICGVLNRYDADTRHEIRSIPVPTWGQDAYGNAVITGWQQIPYDWYRHEVTVDCQVVVLDAVTGRQIAAVSQPVSLSAEGTPPKHIASLLLLAAEAQLIRHVLESVAVTRKEIKVPKDAVRIACDFYDQEWDWQDRFTPDMDSVHVVVRLPAEADRNNFRITIVPKGGREVLAETDFTWNKEHERESYRFSVQELLDRNGYGDYQAKLYSGPSPVAWRNFRIVEPKR